MTLKVTDYQYGQLS